MFGFANAGVAIGAIGPAQLLAPLPLAIAAGLFLGKQIGIFGAVRIAVALRIAEPLRGATWFQVYGMAMLCGIGFTMSLFIATLAFPGDPARIEQAKIGIMLGSWSRRRPAMSCSGLRPGARHQEEQDGQAREIAADGDVATIEER